MTDPAPEPPVSLSKQPAPEPAAEAVPTAVEPTAPADATPPPGRPGRPGRLGALSAVVALTLALAAVAFVVVQRARDAREVGSYYRPASAPMAAARDAGRLLFSYDYRTIDADFSAARALTTGTFRKEYAQTTQSVVRPVAVENKAVVVASPVSQALSRATPGQVVALVFVNQVTTSTKVQGQKVDQSRVRMTLVQRGDRWLVSKVEAL